MLCGLCKNWKQQLISNWFAEALRVRCSLFSWWSFLMPATMQDWWLLPPCLTWMPTMSRPCNRCFWKFTFFFRFCDQDITAGFDSPRPLKCTRNIFLKHDVTNVSLGVAVNWQQLGGAATWADIVYEIDNQSVLYHLLHNVIERYLKPFAQNAMKISIAVQVMSSSVAAAIDTHMTAGKEKYF